jgi:hypothetical protein
VPELDSFLVGERGATACRKRIQSCKDFMQSEAAACGKSS